FPDRARPSLTRPGPTGTGQAGRGPGIGRPPREHGTATVGRHGSAARTGTPQIGTGGSAYLGARVVRGGWPVYGPGPPTGGEPPAGSGRVSGRWSWPLTTPVIGWEVVEDVHGE